MRAKILFIGTKPGQDQEMIMYNDERQGASEAAHRGEPPIVDLDRALQRLDDDRSLFNEMAEFFLADSPTLLGHIRAGVSAREVESEELIRAAHTLKNLAATCGGERAALAAGTVEQLLIAGAWDSLAAACGALEKEAAALADRLRGLVWES